MDIVHRAIFNEAFRILRQYTDDEPHACCCWLDVDGRAKPQYQTKLMNLRIKSQCFRIEIRDRVVMLPLADPKLFEKVNRLFASVHERS